MYLLSLSFRCLHFCACRKNVHTIISMSHTLQVYSSGDLRYNYVLQYFEKYLGSTGYLEKTCVTMSVIEVPVLVFNF